MREIFTPSRVYKSIMAFVIAFATLPILAPILRLIGFGFGADIIYTVYFMFCHQRASHSFHIFDYQFAYCARDTFIWLTAAVLTILRYKFYFKPLKWYWFIIFSIPMAIDGGFQFVGILNSTINNTSVFYESTNLSRAITGSLFGIAVGGSLLAYMIDVTVPKWQKDKRQISIKSGVSITLLIMVLRLF